MSQLELVLRSVIDLFRKYAELEGDRTKLSRGELQRLLQAELTGPLGKGIGTGFVDELLRMLDTNQDGEVDLKEFGGLIGIMAMGYSGKGKWGCTHTQ
ncbi:protein S100-A1-like [Polyodon spathula]|uniref:protein S100-A1-like n=1 Tax=Polyodon spathula TaxID=7913 RepID=UPI001B7EBE44|nr:protein S100-A1-like [Polyodon spathula]XP_041094976.1 protein S100-A1-like [Polyodon spathula]